MQAHHTEGLRRAAQEARLPARQGVSVKVGPPSTRYHRALRRWSDSEPRQLPTPAPRIAALRAGWSVTSARPSTSRFRLSGAFMATGYDMISVRFLTLRELPAPNTARSEVNLRLASKINHVQSIPQANRHRL